MSECTVTGLYPVSKTKVLAAATRAIDVIRAKRKRLFDEECRRIMSRRFFPAKTMEEAAEMVERSTARRNRSFPNGPVAPWTAYGWGVKDRAERMINACNVVDGDIIYLSMEDADMVAKFLARAERAKDNVEAQTCSTN